MLNAIFVAFILCLLESWQLRYKANIVFQIIQKNLPQYLEFIILFIISLFNHSVI